MKPSLRSAFALGVGLGAAALAQAQNSPLIVQAELGALGAEWTVATEGTVGYVTAAGAFGGESPGTAARVGTYPVTFPAAGVYALYARVRVGAGGADDDGFYYGNGWGAKSPAAEADWITVNGLASVGHTGVDDLVTSAGTAGNHVWKWIRLSGFEGGEASTTFVVAAGALTQTFSIGAREDGLQIDQFAFARSDYGFSVANLNNGEAGAPAPTGPALATGQGKFLGGITSTAQLPNFTAYFNQVTPENAGKWGSAEPTRDVMNWTELDAAYALARAQGLPFKFHVLIWGSQQPSWISALSAAEQLEEIEEWFALVAARYPDMDYVEVVNEPLHAPPDGSTSTLANYLNALGGKGTTGWDWVRTSFRLARKHFPNRPLMLNEYSVTNDGSAMTRYLDIVKILQAEKLIDLVGVQGHAFSTTVSAATTAANLERLAATGLPIMVTELDIDGATDAQQLADYQRIFPVFWEHPSVIGITLWGYRPGMWRTAQGAYLVSANGAERPAMQWLAAYVRNRRPVIAAGQGVHVAATATAGTVLGTVRATDADAGSTLRDWRITGGTGQNLFAVDAATGRITVASVTGLNLAAALPYTLTLKVGDGIGTSDAATVLVSTPASIVAPAITAAPASRTAGRGSPVTLTVAATGSASLLYQWSKDGVDLPGAAAADYRIAAVAEGDAGSYRCAVSNAAGSATSAAAVLSVAAPDQGRLANLSVLSQAGAGDKLLIMGFVIGGSGSKPALIRAVGPGLQTVGVGNGFLTDPQLRFFDSSSNEVNRNDDWGGGTTLSEAFARLGAFELDATSKDAALYQSLAPGLYTAQVSAPEGQTGLALVETYDADLAGGSRFVNLSTLKRVGSGDDLLIVGFVITGNTAKTLLIRGVGPSLAKLGVASKDVLADPRLTLFRGATEIAANDNWGGGEALSTVAARVGAFGFASLQGKDAALLVTLEPGLYTARVSGVNDATGLTLVEIYEVD